MQTVYRTNVISGVVLPRSRVMTGVLVVGFALLTALAAQIEIPLGFTPVPITGQTFAVLLTGAVLGSRAGATSQLLYVGLGAAGLPFYSGGGGGWSVATGATGGYLMGFVVSAWLVGLLAEGGQDRKVLTAIPAFLTGNLVIYLFGVPWLANVVGVGWVEAAGLGATPFILGDLVKIGVAGALLPSAWKFANALKR